MDKNSGGKGRLGSLSNGEGAYAWQTELNGLGFLFSAGCFAFAFIALFHFLMVKCLPSLPVCFSLLAPSFGKIGTLLTICRMFACMVRVDDSHVWAQN